MILIKNKKDCCGCSACANVCQYSAITMQQDEQGFLYPHINQEVCRECGLCMATCAFQNRKVKNIKEEEIEAYAVKHQDDEVRMGSSSGGLFTAISDRILDQGGIVYGAAFDSELHVHHARAASRDERNRQRGSKYVQSMIGNTFKQIRDDLLSDRYVLFSGTPCQVDGLNYYIKTNKDKLITIDLVCHGTPSPLVFADYIQFCKKINGSQIIEYYFRTKENGWHGHIEKAIYSDGQIDSTSRLSQAHKQIFYSHLSLRPACFQCKYTNLARPGDITLGDLWGIEKNLISFDDNKGVSLVMLNTEKGMRLFKEIDKDVQKSKINVADFMQPTMKTPWPIPKKQKQFWRDYQKKGVGSVCKKYTEYGFIYRNIKKMKRTIKRVLKSFLGDGRR